MVHNNRKIAGQQVQIENMTNNIVKEGITTLNNFRLTMNDCNFYITKVTSHKAGKINWYFMYRGHKFTSESSLVKFLLK